MSQNTVCLDTELRKLRPAELYMLGQILNISDSWKKLMAIVPKGENCALPKFNAEHFGMIEQAAQQQRRNAAEIFLAEWGTMGKKRPTLHTLLNLLVKAELFRAADYVAGNILKDELPKRPEYGPAAPVDISEEEIRKLLEEKVGPQDNTDFSESLIFRLPSDTNDNKMVNSNVKENILNDNSLEGKMQSTKLVSISKKHNKPCLENIENQQSVKVEMSDLMKFNSEYSTEECRVLNNPSITKIVNEFANTSNINNSNLQECILKKQELSTCELPLFLNEFGHTVEQAKLIQEMVSNELPAFLNNSMATFSNSLQKNSMNNSSCVCTLNIKENEVASAELPQCIVELGADSATNPSSNVFNEQKNITQDALDSQELPITVLEYNEQHNS